MSDPDVPGLPPALNPRGPRGSRRGRTAPHSRRHRLLKRLAIGSGVLVVVLAVGLYALYRYYNGQITRVDIRTTPPAAAPGQSSASSAAEPAKAADGSQNFLLMGSDSRDFAGGSSFNVGPGSAAHVTGQRSDVVMLLHIPAGHAKATVISFPRDSWVHMPAYTDSKGVTHQGVSGKLNAAYALGGAPLLVSTIEELSGMRIDHFVSVNFPGFQGMVDAVGGVNVCIGTSRHDKNSGDFLTAGDHHINGAQALALVRDRESFPNQDLGRIKDQEYFLSVMVHKVLSAGTLSNPLKLTSFLNVATKSLTVDTGLSLSDMRNLASRFAHLDTANLTFETAPVANAAYRVTSSLYGNQMQAAVQLDSVGTAQMFTALKGDSTPTPSTSPSAPAGSLPSAPPSSSLPLSPQDVQLTVDNATSTSGLAHRVATDLKAYGFTVTSTGNAAAGTPPNTVIRYGNGQLLAAQTLQAFVPGAQLQSDDTLTGSLLLVVGDDYQGTHDASGAPVVSGSASAALPSDSPGKPVVSASPMSAANLSCAP